jgi:hypothetical protein
LNIKLFASSKNAQCYFASIGDQYFFYRTH